MNLREVFAASGVQCAHVIDDAYDEVPTWPIEKVAQPFFDNASNEDLERAGVALDVDGVEDALAGEFQYSETFGKLYAMRADFSEKGKAALFSDFEKYRDGKRDLLKPLVTLLEAAGIECILFGATYDPTNAKVPQLLFVDLKLQENTEEFDHKDAVRMVTKLREAHQDCKPFVFLMSSLDSKFPQMREPFREEAELFQSEFEAVAKEKFRDGEGLADLLKANTRAIAQVIQLRDSVNQLKLSFSTATKNVIKELRALDLADYFALYHNTTNIEGTTVGSYIVELLLEFISHEMEGTEAMWKLYRGLEDLNVQKLPRARFGITSPAVRLYSANMLHSNKRLLAEESLNRGPRNGFFYLGDIFCEAQGLNAPVPKKAYAVITPACDIIRPESMVENLLLCEGDVSEFVPGEIPNARDSLPVVVMANPRDADKQIMIAWNKGGIRIWDAKARASFK